MSKYNKLMEGVDNKGGVEDTTLEYKDTKKTRPRTQKKNWGQGPIFGGQTISRPRTGMLEAKAKDQGHYVQVFSKKKKRSSDKNSLFFTKFQTMKKNHNLGPFLTNQKIV